MKNKIIRSVLPLAGALLLAVMAGGCASSGVDRPSGVPVTQMNADEKGFVGGTGIESQDMVSVTDKMSRSILNVPAVQRAATPPYVVLDPVLNETRFPINKDIFLDRVRIRLNSLTQGKVRFLARERLAVLEKERAAKRAGQITSSSDPNIQEFKGADYILTGKLQGMTTKTSKGTSDYVLYSFQLIDARTSEIVWEDMAEIKKQGLEDAAYR